MVYDGATNFIVNTLSFRVQREFKRVGKVTDYSLHKPLSLMQHVTVLDTVTRWCMTVLIVNTLSIIVNIRSVSPTASIILGEVTIHFKQLVHV